MSLPGKILGLDYGKSFIGLAVSDKDQQMAFGRNVLSQKQGEKFVAQALKDLCEKEDIQSIVIGLPLNIEGEETKQTQLIRSFALELEPYLPNIPIFFQDESFTSFEANEFLAEVGVKSRDRKKNEDEMAAIFILNRYLDSIKK